MFWYIIFALSPTIIYVVLLKSFKNNRKLYLTIFGILTFAMIALRHYSVGSTDSLNYYNMWKNFSVFSFEKFESFSATSSEEFGYLLTVWLLSKVFLEPQWVFVFSGLLFTVSVCCFLYKNCSNLLIGATMFICLGLYSFMVQGLRQAVAMSICLFAIEFCKKQKLNGFLAFVFLVLLAIQFHQTAIVFLPIYFLYGKKINSIWTFFIIIGYAVILFLAKDIISFANDLFDRDYRSAVDNGGFIASVIYLIILAVGIIFSTEQNKQDDNFSFFIFLTALGAVVYLMRYFGALAAERISFYFMFGQLVVLPNTVRQFERKSVMVITYFIILLSVALFIYRLSSSDLIPYLFFWQV